VPLHELRYLRIAFHFENALKQDDWYYSGKGDAYDREDPLE
jgi:hypothetical protein